MNYTVHNKHCGQLTQVHRWYSPMGALMYTTRDAAPTTVLGLEMPTKSKAEAHKPATIHNQLSLNQKFALKQQYIKKMFYFSIHIGKTKNVQLYST